MTQFILLFIPFLAGAVSRLIRKKESMAWLTSSLVLPVILFFDEFVLPYRGGGASMWPIALILSGFLGVISGGMGVVVASFYLKKRDKSQLSNRWKRL